MANLDPQQLAAVKTDSRMALVLAGAGAGKTRTLVERVAELVEERKVSPYEILMLTFTRKAAQEMRSRLEDRIGKAAYRVTIGTIHAVALDLLRRLGEYLGLKGKSLTVYSPWEEDFLLREVATDLGLYKSGKWTGVNRGEVGFCFSMYYTDGIEPEEDDSVRKLFLAFIARCRENNAVTFGGLITGMRLLLKQMPAATYLQWRHILVDEVQDNDPLQWAIVREMCAVLNASLFCVGDVDQSIYEWRGAAPEYLVRHAHEFDVYRIESNYRSASEIVLAANRLIERNETRLPKTMRPARVEGSVSDMLNGVEVWPGQDSTALACAIKGYLDINSHLMPSDVAVLARNHKLLEALGEALKQYGVPFARVGESTALTNTEEFRRFHAFLKLLVNPYDNFAFLLIKDLIGLSMPGYAAIRLRAVMESTSHFLVWMESGTIEGWQRLFNEAHNWKLSDTLGNLYSILFDPSLGQLVGESEWNPITGMVKAHEFARAWSACNPSGTVEDYLSWLATYDLQDELKAKEKEDAITLMTVHAAKGLEWPTVIVAGMNEGTLPSKQSMGSDAAMEAERRLAYVAMTRAENNLILAVRPEEKIVNGRIYRSPASRFVAEAGLAQEPAIEIVQ
ncbi:MAG: ATP-dependent helicase [Desulfocurvibacter africanus]